MTIDRLTLYNFGVYLGTNTFQFTHNRPVVLIGGMNGCGKTTFLEAVLLALYGSASIAFQESGHKTYSAYLRAMIHKNATDRRACVELEFTNEEEGSQTYRICREWDALSRKCDERIKVELNGREDDFLTRNWAMFIENLLPCALSSFYFFDGEKIAELASGNADAMLKESIRSMLGINVLEVLRRDLQRSLRRKERPQGEDDASGKLRELESLRDECASALKSVEEKIEALRDAIKQLDKTIEGLRSAYETKGGQVLEQRQNLLQKQAALDAEAARKEEELLDLAASALPLSMVKDLLYEIKLQAEDEHSDAVMTEALARMNDLLEEFGDFVPDEAAAGRHFIDFVRESAKSMPVEPIYQLSDHALYQTIALLETELDVCQSEAKEYLARKQALREQRDDVASYLTLDLDEKSLRALSDEIQIKTEERAARQAELKELEQQNAALSNRLTLVNAEYTRKVEAWLESLEMNDENERLVRYTHLALKLLDEYVIALQERKTGVLSETITDCYKKLSNKKNLIDRIDMDSRTLEIRYFDAQSREVLKTSLSAGEKQLMVIAILWALAICSRKKLPVIIDTPLSRMDSLHREALIRIYFPQASRQTIILSTDSEVNRTYHDMLKDSIGDEFTLRYDEASGSTHIEKGYF